MNKEELFKTGTKEEIDEKTKYMTLNVTFNVVCNSSPWVQENRSIIARVAQYVNDCSEAMDESMRHWGDHSHFIEPVSIKLHHNTEDEYDNEGQELIDILDDNDYYDSTLEKYNIKKIEAC